MSAADHIEEVCEVIVPDESIKSMTKGSSEEQGGDQFLAAVMFIAGSDKSKFEDCVKKLADDHAGGRVSRCPKTVEKAVDLLPSNCCGRVDWGGVKSNPRLGLYGDWT